jgi:hypothetical protein
MVVMRHAALRALEQHIIWQQFIMKVETTAKAGAKSKPKPSQSLDAWHSKK